jgi:putative membrane protein
LIAFILAPVILSAVNTFLSQYFAEKYPQFTSVPTDKKLSS